MDIYAASEKPIEGVTAESLVERIRQFGHRGAEYVGTIDRGVDALLGVRARRRSGTDARSGQRLAGRRQSAGPLAGRLIMARESKKSEAKARTGIRWRLWAWTARGLHRVRLDRLGGAHRCGSSRSPIRSSSCCATSRKRLTIAGLKYTLARQGRARLRGRFRAQHLLRSRWRSAGAGCWPIDWVEDASVMRIWPDRLTVEIHERKPVAFVFSPLRRAR